MRPICKFLLIQIALKLCCSADHISHMEQCDCRCSSDSRLQLNEKIKHLQAEFTEKLSQLSSSIESAKFQLNSILVEILNDLQDTPDRPNVTSTHTASASPHEDQPFESVLDKKLTEQTDCPDDFDNSKCEHPIDTSTASTTLPKLQRISTKPSKCEICQETLPTGRQLISHRVNVHGHPKPIPCTVCDKRFMDTSNLRHHMLIHKRPRKEAYVCDFCSMVIRDRHAFLSHRRSHTGGCFECDICQKRFVQKNALSSHMRIHSGERPYICHLCCKSFRHQPALRRHIQMHAGVRPHQCKLCQRSFLDKSILDIHMMAHTGARPHSCPICDKGYTRRYLVKKHLRKFHQVKDVESILPKLLPKNNLIVQ